MYYVHLISPTIAYYNCSVNCLENGQLVSDYSGTGISKAELGDDTPSSPLKYHNLKVPLHMIGIN